MAIVPLLFRDWWVDDYDMPITSRIMDQHFGSGLLRDDLINSIWGERPTLTRSGYMRPWHRPASSLLKAESGSTVNLDKDKFEVILDVQQFSPKEVNVKVVDNYIVVEGKHEEKQDEHGFISRQFCRRYKLPKDVNPDQIKSSLSSDGLLTVTAPMKALQPPPGERAIPITHTGKPAKKDEPMQVENNKA